MCTVLGAWVWQRPQCGIFEGANLMGLNAPPYESAHCVKSEIPHKPYRERHAFQPAT